MERKGLTGAYKCGKNISLQNVSPKASDQGNKRLLSRKMAPPFEWVLGKGRNRKRAS